MNNRANDSEFESARKKKREENWRVKELLYE